MTYKRFTPEQIEALKTIQANKGSDYIINAVNAHEELVEALMGLLKAADQMNEHIDVTAYNKAQEALKKSGAL